MICAPHVDLKNSCCTTCLLHQSELHHPKNYLHLNLLVVPRSDQELFYPNGASCLLLVFFEHQFRNHKKKESTDVGKIRKSKCGRGWDVFLGLGWHSRFGNHDLERLCRAISRGRFIKKGLIKQFRHG